ncbi:hypothetical protein [Bifidobacterium eulemuris]|nr:hypothetical protein [Bifidobacterium eulemuris]QOL32677.1 hypothetical protein BE0216_09690 [Bifidobacterium eulemuris]
MLTTIGFSIIHMFFYRHHNYFWKETKQIILLIIGITFVSCLQILQTGQFTSLTVDNLLKILLPAIMAYGVLNTLSFKELQNCMVIIFISSVIGYLCELGFKHVSIDMIVNADYANSSSPFESSYFAGMSITLCFFYCYYRKNRLLTILSVLYVIATFKRLAIIFAILFFILPFFLNLDKKLPTWNRQVLKLFFLLVTYIYYWLLLPQTEEIFFNIFHDTQQHFTMGRNVFLDTLINSDYRAFGYGSTDIVLGFSLEMDLIQIALEMGPIILFLFINSFWNLTADNIYITFIILFEFANFLTSHSLNSNYKWGLTFIVIGMIVYMSKERDNFFEKSAGKQNIYTHSHLYSSLNALHKKG